MNFIFVILIVIVCYFLGTFLFNFISKKFFKSEKKFNILSFLKRYEKELPDELKKALEQGFITEEEMLRLRLERAEKILKQYLSDKK